MDDTENNESLSALETAVSEGSHPALEPAVSVSEPSQQSSDTELLLKHPDMDLYNEDQVELQFLLSKPTCFIVFGKPGAGKTTLAKKLALEWNCILINPTDIINVAVEEQTEMGVKAQEILTRGEAVPEEMVVKMIEEKISSPEVTHHGYVLDGFPSLSEEFMPLKDQLELIKNWKLKPDFIINTKLPDADLESRRIALRVDPATGDIYTKEQYAPERPKPVVEEGGEEDGEEEEEMEEEELGDEEETVEELPVEILSRLIKRPEDLQHHVKENLDFYKNNLLRIIEDYMADHDQQYLIELDGNRPANVLFKDLMARLQCFVLRPAAVPVRLIDADDDEIPEEIENDELMRTLSSRKFVAPRFRWRRSRFLRNCPVALSEGNIIPGKPEFSVSFLDKMYVLSTADAMEKFLKNPRPYLMPPQPRPPCKVSITGPPLSGKTTMAHLLAQKYGAKVLDIDELIKPRLEEEKQRIVAQVREETTEAAINTVKAKIKEQLEAEVAAREAQASEDTGDTMTDGPESRTEDPTTSSEAPEENEAIVGKEEEDGVAPEAEAADEEIKDTEEKPAVEGEEESQPKPEGDETVSEAVDDEKPDPGASPEEPEPPKEPEVDATHPEVVAIVEAAVKVVESQEVTLQPEVYVEVMEEAIKEAEKEMRKKNESGPLYGGWILDNFPRTRDQWTAVIEKGTVPDDIICLRDASENGDFLIRRWYNLNRREIDEKIRARKEQEELEKKQKEEEQKRKEEEERLAQEEEERKKREEERQRRIDEGEELSEGESEKVELEEEETEVKEVPLPEGLEVDAQRQKRKDFDQEWPGVHAVIVGNTGIEPMMVDIEDRQEEDILREMGNQMENQFTYQGWERAGNDIDEEEEDLDADQEEEEGEEEEEEDPNRSLKKTLGDTSYFCPVSLLENNVLWPGNPEISAKYREKIYYLSTPEARDKFLQEPTKYIPDDKPPKPPALRIIILGAKGSGKSMHGREMAHKLGVFHIQFRERLQELIIAKTKKKVGPEFEDDEEEPDIEEEEEAGITSPDGAVMKDSLAPDGVTVTDGEEKEEEEEEEEAQLTEDEENIKAYLETDEPLPLETLDKIIPDWWNKEPFKSTGFILEGFPRTPDEAAYIGEAGLFPDGVIAMMVEDSDVIGRLLPPKMDKWRTKRDKRLEKKRKSKEKKQKERDTAIAKKREEIMKEREEKRAERKAAKGTDSDAESGDEEVEEEEEEEEEEDIEDIIAEAFPEEEEEEEEEEELEEDAEERIRNEMSEVYDNDTNRLMAVQEKLTELLLPVIEIEAGRKPHIVRYSINKKTCSLIQFRKSIFERVYPISEPLAKRMLYIGYKQQSRFGRWCPVQLHDGECMQPMQGPGYPVYPAIYRQHVYFLSSVAARERFSQNPMSFLSLPSPKPVVPMRLAIVGPPKSGKTSLARRFEEDCGMMRLSIGEALRMVVTNQPQSDLGKQITNHMYKGLTVPDELSIQALEVALLDMKCQTRGFVLDGFPVTKQQIDLMSQRSIIPVVVLELQLDSKEVMVRGTKDRYSNERLYPMHDSAQILSIKLGAYQQHIQSIRDWYQTEHRNYSTLPGDRSKWWLWCRASEINKASVRQIQTYLHRTAEGKAASIYNMCITPSEFRMRLGDYGQYCPVSLALREELVDCSVTPALDYAAEFRGHYYKMAGPSELEAFLAEPEKFVAPLAPQPLPPAELLPRRWTDEEIRAKFPIPFELQGYCPVTFLDGKCRYECIVPGNPDLVIEYRERLYCCECEAKLQKFMRQPGKYWALKLPHKLPPKKDPLQLTKLPMLGFMEQTVSDAITKSLTACGCFKPKYPFLTPSRSALLYVAYHLKAYNTKSSEYVRKKYKRKLQDFEETCRLIKYLGDNMTVRYKEPDDRPEDFDIKLELFLQLKGKEPTTTWVA